MWKVQLLPIPWKVIEMKMYCKCGYSSSEQTVCPYCNKKLIIPSICPICGRPKGCVEGAWICFTPWWECGVNSMTSNELEAFTILRESVDRDLYSDVLSIWRNLKLGDHGE